MNTSPELMTSLNTDLGMEHGAILQYVVHGVALRDSSLGDLVRRTAREEMWHFEWLVEAIRARGGEPSLKRADIFTSASVSRSIEVDVATEDAALAHYATTLELVGETDRGLTALIARIIDDEHHHRAGFARLADRIAADGDAAHSAKPDIDPKDFAVIGPVIATEYGGTLQYILNKSGVGDCDAADTYFELAVDEMRHILWAASYTAGFGEPQAPPPPPDWVAYPAGEDDALRMATELERRAEPFYTAMVSQASDTRLKSDLGRAGGNHDYHRHLLAVMSKGPEEPASR